MVNKLSPTLFARRCERLAPFDPRARDWRRLGCLEWLGVARSVRIDGRDWHPQRAAWTVYFGPVPSGMSLLPLCGNWRCCEREHLAIAAPPRGRPPRPLPISPLRAAAHPVVLDARRLAKRVR